jgi:shikimate dehydrogenase
LTEQLGLIGYPVRRSPSPAMHQAAFSELGLDWHYSLIEVAAGGLPTMWPDLRARLLGANVTTPHKGAAADLVDRASPEARAARSVNTVVFTGDEAVGESTDGAGFMRALDDAGQARPRAALILGSGGAARAVATALLAGDCQVTLAARNPARGEAVASQLGGRGAPAVSVIPFHHRQISETVERCDLLVNATTVGSSSDPGDCPLPQQVMLHPGLTVFDLVYGSSPTELLRRADRAGCRTVPGVEMLVHQAAQSLQIWSGQRAPIEVMREAAVRHLERQEVAS